MQAKWVMTETAPGQVYVMKLPNNPRMEFNKLRVHEDARVTLDILSTASTKKCGYLFQYKTEGMTAKFLLYNSLFVSYRPDNKKDASRLEPLYDEGMVRVLSYGYDDILDDQGSPVLLDYWLVGRWRSNSEDDAEDGGEE